MTKKDTLKVLVAMANSYEIDTDLVEIVKNNFDELDIVKKRAHKETRCEYKRFTDQALALHEVDERMSG